MAYIFRIDEYRNCRLFPTGVILFSKYRTKSAIITIFNLYSKVSELFDLGVILFILSAIFLIQ
jgi:hypothetical protein